MSRQRTIFTARRSNIIDRTQARRDARQQRIDDLEQQRIAEEQRRASPQFQRQQRIEQARASLTAQENILARERERRERNIERGRDTQFIDIRIREDELRVQQRREVLEALESGFDVTVTREPSLRAERDAFLGVSRPRSTPTGVQTLELLREQARQRGEPLPTSILQDSRGNVTVVSRDTSQVADFLGVTSRSGRLALQQQQPSILRSLVASRQQQEQFRQQRESERISENISSGRQIFGRDIIPQGSALVLTPQLGQAFEQRTQPRTGLMTPVPTTEQPTRQTPPQTLTRGDRFATFIFERTQPVLQRAQRGAENIGQISGTALRQSFIPFRFVERGTDFVAPRGTALRQEVDAFGRGVVTEVFRTAPATVEAGRNVLVGASAQFFGSPETRQRIREERPRAQAEALQSLSPVRRTEEGQFFASGETFAQSFVVVGGLGLAVAGRVSVARPQTIPRTGGRIRFEIDQTQVRTAVRGQDLPVDAPFRDVTRGTFVQETRGVPRFTGRPEVRTRVFESTSGDVLIVQRAGRSTRQTQFQRGDRFATQVDILPSGRTRSVQVRAPTGDFNIPQAGSTVAQLTPFRTQRAEVSGGVILREGSFGTNIQQISGVSRQGLLTQDFVRARVRQAVEVSEVTTVTPRPVFSSEVGRAIADTPSGRRLAFEQALSPTDFATTPTRIRRARSIGDQPELITNIQGGTRTTQTVSPAPLVAQQFEVVTRTRTTGTIQTRFRPDVTVQGVEGGAIFGSLIPLLAPTRSPTTRTTRSSLEPTTRTSLEPVGTAPTQLFTQTRARLPRIAQRSPQRFAFAPQLGQTQTTRTQPELIDISTPASPITQPQQAIRQRQIQQPAQIQTPVFSQTPVQQTTQQLITQQSNIFTPPLPAPRTPRAPRRRSIRPLPPFFPNFGGSSAGDLSFSGTSRRTFLRTPSLIAGVRNIRSTRSGLDVTGLQIRGL